MTGAIQPAADTQMISGRLEGQRAREPALIELPVRRDARGSLTFLEEDAGIPFKVRRIFYIYDLVPGATRGSHSASNIDEIVIAVTGRFNVVTVDGSTRREFALKRRTQALFIPGRVWRELSGFSDGAVCLVLASTLYAPSPDDTGHERQHEG